MARAQLLEGGVGGKPQAEIGYPDDSVLAFRRTGRFTNSQPILPFRNVSIASNGRPFLEINRFRRSLLPSTSILRICSGGISHWRMVLLILKEQLPLATFSQI